MKRSILMAGVIALATPALAFAQPDPSNPAAAPLSPSQDAANQPGRGEVPSSALPADARDAMETRPPLTGTAAQDAETEADRQAREESARPRGTTVRAGDGSTVPPEEGGTPSGPASGQPVGAPTQTAPTPPPR